MEIVLDRRRAGHDNMGIDKALLVRGRPIVRLYGWSPSCVSVGYTQDPADVDQALLGRLGIDLVERPTGGGAILHEPSEVTYCVVLPTDHPGVPTDLFESYRVMSAGVVETLGRLGAGATYIEGRGGRDAFCYVREAGVSIGVAGLKVSGGAQRRTRSAILQHGTLLVDMNVTLLADIFGQDPDVIARKVGSLASLGLSTDRSHVMEVMAASFAQTLGARDPVRLGPEQFERELEASTSL